MEQWKDIAGYEGLYAVSNQGRVKSLERTVVRGNGRIQSVPERILKPNKNNDGYQLVVLYKEGKRKTIQVHRLVVNAFIPNPENLPQVNHKDENKENNHVDNLEFCDAKYNSNYGTRNERRVEKQRNDPKKSKPVHQFTVEGSFVREWSSINEAGRNGYSTGNIWTCCIGKRNKHRGYIWRYKEDAPA